MKTITILQARTSSSRLPAKALLRVAGFPSAILAALRAANQNHLTILATSDDASDDELAGHARQYGLTVFRGPLQDVLQRYTLACSSLPEDYAVIRLTADNLVPDGAFVGELAKAFELSKAEYLSTDSAVTGLPYGLGGEVFSISTLRRTHRAATHAADREHVGTWMRRNCRSVIYHPQRVDDFNYSQLRCTIDDADDYERIVRLFESAADPVGVGWQDLLAGLARMGASRFRVPFRQISGRDHSKFTLGTAQLGMEYGAMNVSGKPPTQRAISIVRQAVAHGVTHFDTARSYGVAEEVLGTALRGGWGLGTQVVTKLDLSGLGTDATPRQVRERVDESVGRSCDVLGRSRLDVLLLHRWQDYHGWNAVAWERLLELREQGRVGVLGASVYQTKEALEALQDRNLAHLQIPMNVLDWRWETDAVDQAIASRRDVVVHARSALLQGILAHPANRWPCVGGFHASESAEALIRLAKEFARESVKDLCLAYVRSLPWVSSVVVGCETMEQLEENLGLCQTADLSPEQCRRLRGEVPRAPEALLNASKWKMTHESSAVSR